MKPTKILMAGLLTILPISSTNAEVLAEWTFNTGPTSVERLASGGVAAGALVSGLMLNQSFTDFGPGAVPNDVHDGFGFGGNRGDQVIFLHRAEYFDASEVPAPRPAEDDYTSWGPGSSQGTGADLNTNGNAPIAFTVTGDAISTVTIESITVDFTSGGGIIFGFQEAGDTSGATVTLNGANPLLDVPLDAPVIVGPGETKTFTININSGALNSLHNIDGISLNGSVVREEHPPLAEWTFDSGDSSVDLLASSGVVEGATISGLSFNDSFTDFGPEAVPNDVHDGERSQDRLTLARNMLKHCRVETRASISDLRSPSLLKKSLPEAMQETLPAAADGSKFRFIVDGTPRQLPATTTNHILRIAREAVINARRHAKPTRIEVCLHYEPDEIRLEINDDGTGFDPKQRPPAGHFGITGMRERTNKISAEFTIESSSSTGTKVQLRLPSSSPANQSTNN
ncbi:ATP-binding protein [Akkermansiaceae bacterium]|nr:ATP-binding protein [Akkermansiaceae bacterium]MDB4499519.1 ATP-binding protein [Akkermansiaceae bacterium]